MLRGKHAVLNDQTINLMIRVPLVVLTAAVVSACAHQTAVSPSKGHIGSRADVAATQPAIPDVVKAPIPKPVRSSPLLPPPKAIKKSQTYSVVVNEVSASPQKLQNRLCEHEP